MQGQDDSHHMNDILIRFFCFTSNKFYNCLPVIPPLDQSGLSMIQPTIDIQGNN
jgi:hypothetical protein